MIYIYALIDPGTGVPRYVGQTTNLDARLKMHLSTPSSVAVKIWIHSLKQEGKQPSIQMLEKTNLKEANGREAYWIRHIISRGNDILNIHLQPKATRRGYKAQRLNVHDFNNIRCIREHLNLDTDREAINAALAAYAAQLKRDEQRDVEAHTALKHGG